jgi:hypothetical protein
MYFPKKFPQHPLLLNVRLFLAPNNIYNEITVGKAVDKTATFVVKIINWMG